MNALFSFGRNVKIVCVYRKNKFLSFVVLDGKRRRYTISSIQGLESVVKTLSTLFSCFPKRQARNEAKQNRGDTLRRKLRPDWMFGPKNNPFEMKEIFRAGC